MLLFSSLNDDQIALLGCGVALMLCGGGMVLSYTLRRWITGMSRGRGDQRHSAATLDPQIAQQEADQRRAA